MKIFLNPAVEILLLYYEEVIKKYIQINLVRAGVFIYGQL